MLPDVANTNTNAGMIDIKPPYFVLQIGINAMLVAAAPTAAIKTISVNIPFRKQNKDINVDKMIDGSKR